MAQFPLINAGMSTIQQVMGHGPKDYCLLRLVVLCPPQNTAKLLHKPQICGMDPTQQLCVI
jgi:hypothetical protein